MEVRDPGTPLSNADKNRDYSIKKRGRSPSPESLEGHEIVPIHPSHKGSTYQRRPKKKKKKIKKVIAPEEEETPVK